MLYTPRGMNNNLKCRLNLKNQFTVSMDNSLYNDLYIYFCIYHKYKLYINILFSFLFIFSYRLRKSIKINHLEFFI